MKCRHCKTDLKYEFLNLGFAPPSNAYLMESDLDKPEKYFPLRIKVCHKCWLVQTEDYTNAEELFNDQYAYYSSTSVSWLRHAEQYVEKITQKLNLSESSHVVEVASNDGYLLRNFIEKNIPCLGIEPTASTADEAEKLGIPILREFFGEISATALAREGKKADLIIGNNVYAHVPDINDFTKGLTTLLKADGTITLEFPHLLNLIKYNQFDTVYHEHFSYLSLITVAEIFRKAGLRVYDVEKLETHGGSLRIYGCHDFDPRTNELSVEEILCEEVSFGLSSIDTYLEFQRKADDLKNDFLSFLVEQKALGKKVVAYGAAAKGNTLLNYAGVKPDLLSFVCDASAAKQSKFLPGSHIPIVPPKIVSEQSVDYIVILPWNISSEVLVQNSELIKKGVKFVTVIPKLQVV